MSVIKKELLNKVLADLKLTNNQVIEEGFFNRLGNKIAGAGSSALNAVKNMGQAGMAAPANAVRAVSNAASNAFQTDRAIINAGLLFKDKNGNFLGVSNIDPKSKEGSFLTQQYINNGYTPAEPADRQVALQKGITVHRPKKMFGNLKKTTVDSLETLKNLTSQLEKQVAGKPLFTDQDANQLYQQLVQFIKQSITKATNEMAPGPENKDNLTAPAAGVGAGAPAAASVKKTPPWRDAKGKFVPLTPEQVATLSKQAQAQYNKALATSNNIKVTRKQVGGAIPAATVQPNKEVPRPQNPTFTVN
ncbi:MAG: hypothetical protein WCO84_06700 [bacterium]